jgi:2-dehydropantoate 2-reductase
MRIAVVGLGAVGGFLAARLAGGGHAVSALVRGATLAAVRSGGLQFEEAGRHTRLEVAVSDAAADLGPQDLVIVAVKAHALATAAGQLGPLLGADTPVLTAMNGVPWWFMQTRRAASDAADAQPLQSVDPFGHIGARLPLARVLAGVVHLTCSAPEPGRIRHGHGGRLIVGEPAGGLSERAERVAEALRRGGLDIETSQDIRSAIWFKLWGNMTANPVSALTGATTDRIIDDPLVRGFCLAAMAEAAEVGARIGCPIAQTAEERLAVGRQLGVFKTSMLQDVEAGRPIELQALVGAVREIGQRTGVPTPTIDHLLGLARLMAQSRGLMPPEPAA